MTAPSTVIVLGNFLGNNCRQQLPTEATETNQRTLRSQLRHYAAAKLVTEVDNDQVAKHHPGTLADLPQQRLGTVAAERSA
jgi:hypothetical protein